MVSFRPTTETDRIQLAALLATVWKGEEGGAAYHGGGRRAGWLAYAGEDVVGYGQLWHSVLHPTYAYVGVHVHPDWRGQGIGGHLWKTVTSGADKPLKAKTYATQRPAVRFLERHGLTCTVQTHEPTLALAHLSDPAAITEAKQLGFRLLPMTALPSELGRQLLPLHREVYRHTHLHDPAQVDVMDEEDFLGDDLCPDWLFVAEKGNELAGVASVRRSDAPDMGELAWFGVTERFAATGQPLTLALVTAALQAARVGGVRMVNAELDSADPNALHLWHTLPWIPGKTWLTLAEQAKPEKTASSLRH
ncbi:GNAT family N-acetyltransferase [Deinococcus wulumuqiensis]|uniref:GNAT family N-acetyltransferase n=1 Tax=Deinococcus wulumuqiensis TaxID=980427 RepID=UPI00242CF997|nr:GNAT family N-acetyltransferase [Deinococcus wulumuqiensis]